MIKNKKGSYGLGLFGFFFSMTIVTMVTFFALVVLPAILFDYGISIASDTNQNMVDAGISSAESQTNINQIKSSYMNMFKMADYVFMALIITLVIQSFITAALMRREGLFSFFGLITLGNVILIFSLTFAVTIKDWFLNNFIYNILLISVETPFINWWFANTILIGSIWFSVLLFVNIIDFRAIGSRFNLLSERDQAPPRIEE
jgi:hypothetical protein